MTAATRHLDRHDHDHLHLPVAASTDGGATWTDIAGATATTYTPPAGSAGKQVRVLVTGTNGDGNSQAASPASAAILPDPPVNTTAPTLTGTAQDGQTLGLNVGTWTGIATITYTYQWQLSTDGGLTWTDIPGATATTYTPPAGTAGKQARVLVTGTNLDGSSQVASPASVTILPDPPVNATAPTLTGTAQDGQALGLNVGTWTGIATITYTYQWQLSADGGLTWTDIPGATATTYTPPVGTAGKQVRVLETATNADGNSQAASPASALILADPPVNTAAPTLTGTAQDGQPLGLNNGVWTGLATITYTYQWQISADGGATWSNIFGATATTYTPTTGAVGKQVRVLETGTNADGNSQAASLASAVILPKPPAPTAGGTATTTTQPVPAQPAVPQPAPNNQSTSEPVVAKPSPKQAKPKPKKPKPKHTKRKPAKPKQKPGKSKHGKTRAAPQWHLVPR